MIQIEPVPMGRASVATQLEITVLQMSVEALNCTLVYSLKSAGGETLECKNLSLTEAEFASWGIDMQYITNLVCAKLELTLKTE